VESIDDLPVEDEEKEKRRRGEKVKRVKGERDPHHSLLFSSAPSLLFIAGWG
jgi:hypothetical protein